MCDNQLWRTLTFVHLFLFANPQNTNMTTKAIEETPWVDAWIRWEKNSMAVYNCDNDDQDAVDDEDEELPQPTESYTFTYPNSNGSGEVEDIRIRLRGYRTDSQEIWKSTGLTLWQSSHHLCQYLLNHLELFQDASNTNMRILEVGSGLGRCGLLAHHLSRDKATTVLTDGDIYTLKQLRQNIRDNTTEEDENILCRQLLWGEKYAETFLLQQPEEKRKFDIILGSDLIYAKSVIGPLFETVRVLLSAKVESKFLMAHCSRRKGNEVDVCMFLDVAEKEGFQHEVLIEDGDISVFAFHRKVNS